MIFGRNKKHAASSGPRGWPGKRPHDLFSQARPAGAMYGFFRTAGRPQPCMDFFRMGLAGRAHVKYFFYAGVKKPSGHFFRG